MSELPPSLLWLETFRASASRALGDDISLRLVPSVNPLLHEVYLDCSPSTSGTQRMLVWNLLQQWAVKNGCPLQGKDIGNPLGLRFQVVTTRRFGPPRNDWPY